MTSRLLAVSAVVAIATIGIVALFVLREASVTVVTGPDFEPTDLSIRDYDLFDLGVTDVDGDTDLDVFTANHSARQSLLLNDGAGRFEDALSRMKLDQARRFPALEDSLDAPDTSLPGLYVYRQDRWLHVRAKSVDGENPVSGTLTVPWPVVLDGAPPGVAQEYAAAPDGGTGLSTVRFELSGDQSFSLNGVEDIVELPHHLALDPNVDLARVYIGLALTRPDSHDVVLTWRDRHGMAWTDFDGDGHLDVFIARGGVKGQLDRFAEPFHDELMAGTGTTFADRTPQADLDKGNCPARQAAWVDFDSDGDLDLHVTCGRGPEPDFPDHLYEQVGDGRFRDVAAALGIDYGAASVFSWFDADGDGDPDLLAFEGDRFVHYVNDGGRLSASPVAGDLEGSKPYKLAVADFDGDGDGDVYAVHGRHSLLLVNEDGRFRIERPGDYGLPASGRTASWIDVDNDSLPDLHVVPGGIYRQSDDGRFSATGALAYEGDTDQIVDARTAWFDMDNDGDRDAILSALLGPTIPQRFLRKFAGRAPDLGDHWRTTVLTATGEQRNHWLEVELRGPEDNRQGIGAKIVVASASGPRTQEVGWTEGSHFGQGHYRSYFGLGALDGLTDVRVTWPDGTEQHLANVETDRLLEIEYEETEYEEIAYDDPAQ